MSPHLQDLDIDMYVAGRLPEDRQLAVEAHFVDCRECAARVEAVEELAQGLREIARPRFRGRLLLAAAAAVVAVAGGFVLRRSHPLPEPPAQGPTPVPGVALGSGGVELRLEAATRGPEIARVSLDSRASHLTIHLDTREIAVPGSRFDVSLYDANGKALVSLRGLKSAPDGNVLLTIPTSTLLAGEYMVGARAGDGELRVPFLVER